MLGFAPGMPFECHEEGSLFVIRASGVLRLEDVDTLAEEEERYFARPGRSGLFLCDCTDLKVVSQGWEFSFWIGYDF